MNTVLSFVVLLGVLIFVHEYGHYAVARWCGVKVLRFSIGFGQPVKTWRVGKDRTEWSLSWIPLGGYVRMLDEREAEVDASERHRAFNQQSVWHRSAIVAAGPLANFLLAWLLYAFFHIHGSEAMLPVLGAPAEGTPAAMAGVENGETVVRVDGVAVASWQDFRWEILQQAVSKPQLVLTVQSRQGAQVERTLNVQGFTLPETGETDPLADLGLRFYQSEAPPKLGQIVTGSIAAQAGLLTGDDILSVNDVAVDRWLEFVQLIRKQPGVALDLLVLRQGVTLHITVTPDAVEQGGQSVGRIGVGMAPDENAPVLRTSLRYGLGESLWRGARETYEQAAFSLKMMGKMVLGEVSWKNLSGPVTIADYAGQTARMGWEAYLRFMALLSVSLGVLNLLPVPVLDGGHLMYHILEVIKGGPLSERAMALGQKVGMSLLLVLMAFAFFNDLSRLLSG